MSFDIVLFAIWLGVAVVGSCISVVVMGAKHESFDNTALAIPFCFFWPLVVVFGIGYGIFRGLYKFGEWLADRDDKSVESELPEARARRRSRS